MARSSAAPRQLKAFLKLIDKRRGFLDGDGDVFIARAPARLDVMGGIADYCGSVVLEGTLERAAMCAVQLSSHGEVRLHTHGVGKEGLAPECSWTLGDIPDGFSAARGFFMANPATAWSGYLAGHLVTLRSEGLLNKMPAGVNIMLSSDAPLGAGVASSAAIEVACMEALAAALGIELDGLELARLCQITENRVVGAPCGIMDQVTCCLGDTDRLLALKCQPHEVTGLVDLPPGIHAVGINSNIKHAVGGSKYARARVGAFMGLKIIGAACDRDLGGYLSNLDPDEFQAEHYEKLPAKTTGAEFIRQFGSTDDTVTTIDPDETYSVRACAMHPVYENRRVQSFIALLERAHQAPDDDPLIKAGKLMYASHWSYGKLCGLGSRETDLLVKLIRDKGVQAGLYGAKITGGGSGGTVAVLARGDVSGVLAQIVGSYEEKTGLKPELLTGSSPGSRAFGLQKA